MNKGFTVWIDSETKNGLKKLAKANERNMAAQLRWMVKRELELLDAAKNQPTENEQH